MSMTGRVFFEAAQYLQLDGNGAQECQQISSRLRHLNTHSVQKNRENQYEWNEEQALSCDSQKGCWYSSSNGLHHHIAHNYPALRPHGQALELQGTGAEFNDGRIIAERTRKEVEERGESLQELFFEITEHREARE